MFQCSNCFEDKETLEKFVNDTSLFHGCSKSFKCYASCSRSYKSLKLLKQHCFRKHKNSKECADQNVVKLEESDCVIVKNCMINHSNHDESSRFNDFIFEKNFPDHRKRKYICDDENQYMINDMFNFQSTPERNESDETLTYKDCENLSETFVKKKIGIW